MYKDKRKQKEANRIAAKAYRKKGMKDYPLVVHLLVEKRPLLEYLCYELKQKGLLDSLHYGAGLKSINFKTIALLLKATE